MDRLIEAQAVLALHAGENEVHLKHAVARYIAAELVVVLANPARRRGREKNATATSFAKRSPIACAGGVARALS